MFGDTTCIQCGSRIAPGQNDRHMQSHEAMRTILAALAEEPKASFGRRLLDALLAKI